jgi:hypothetical protein
VQDVVLGDEPDAGFVLGVPWMVKRHRARLGRCGSGERGEQRRLAGPARADDGGQVSRLDRDRQVIEGDRSVAVSGRETDCGDPRAVSARRFDRQGSRVADG